MKTRERVYPKPRTPAALFFFVHQAERADLHDVAVSQEVRVDAVVVYPYPVKRCLIGDLVTRIHWFDRRVRARDGHIVEEDVALRAAAHGKTIGRQQLNQLKIAEMAIKLKNMKNMLYEAAWDADNNDGKFDPGAAAMCKYYCANAAFSVVDDGMQVLAGVAVAGEHRAQRIWRDLRVDRVSGGTDEMMILTASKFELKKYRD